MRRRVLWRDLLDGLWQVVVTSYHEEDGTDAVLSVSNPLGHMVRSRVVTLAHDWGDEPHPEDVEYWRTTAVALMDEFERGIRTC